MNWIYIIVLVNQFNHLISYELVGLEGTNLKWNNPLVKVEKELKRWQVVFLNINIIILVY